MVKDLSEFLYLGPVQHMKSSLGCSSLRGLFLSAVESAVRVSRTDANPSTMERCLDSSPPPPSPLAILFGPPQDNQDASGRTILAGCSSSFMRRAKYTPLRFALGD